MVTQVGGVLQRLGLNRDFVERFRDPGSKQLDMPKLSEAVRRHTIGYASRFHPDQNVGDAHAEQMFKDVMELGSLLEERGVETVVQELYRTPQDSIQQLRTQYNATLAKIQLDNSNLKSRLIQTILETTICNNQHIPTSQRRFFIVEPNVASATEQGRIKISDFTTSSSIDEVYGRRLTEIEIAKGGGLKKYTLRPTDNVILYADFEAYKPPVGQLFLPGVIPHFAEHHGQSDLDSDYEYNQPYERTDKGTKLDGAYLIGAIQIPDFDEQGKLEEALNKAIFGISGKAATSASGAPLLALPAPVQAQRAERVTNQALTNGLTTSQFAELVDFYTTTLDNDSLLLAARIDETSAQVRILILGHNRILDEKTPNLYK